MTRRFLPLVLLLSYLAASAQTAPAPPPKATAAPGATDMPVGSQVTVARQGVRANGVIEKLMPDGRYQVGFPATVTSRPQGDNIYSKEEISMMLALDQGAEATAWIALGPLLVEE